MTAQDYFALAVLLARVQAGLVIPVCPPKRSTPQVAERPGVTVSLTLEAPQP